MAGSETDSLSRLVGMRLAVALCKTGDLRRITRNFDPKSPELRLQPVAALTQIDDERN